MLKVPFSRKQRFFTCTIVSNKRWAIFIALAINKTFPEVNAVTTSHY